MGQPLPEFRGIPREFRGIVRKGRFTRTQIPKKGAFSAENCQKKAHFGRFFNPNSAEFRGIPRRVRKPPKSAKFGILALKLTEIRKLQLLRWIREEAGQCRLFVSPTMQFPLKITGFCKKACEFQEKCKNDGPFRSKALCGTTFPSFLAFGLKSTRDGALTAVTVRVRTFGHLQVAGFPTNLGLVDRWLG